MHEEGSMGFLEVLPEYQRRGIGKYLETYLMNVLLQDRQVVYAQIKKDNKESIALHKKLGFVMGEECVWMMPE